MGGPLEIIFSGPGAKQNSSVSRKHKCKACARFNVLKCEEGSFSMRSMNLKSKLPLLIIIGLIAASSVAVSGADQNKGPAEIKLAGGTKGKVPFPHHRHQEVLGDCNLCHAVFEQKVGIIEELKAQGKLKKKYVMNKLCTKCHREKKKAGLKSGPTSCNRCHIKG